MPSQVYPREYNLSELRYWGHSPIGKFLIVLNGDGQKKGPATDGGAIFGAWARE